MHYLQDIFLRKWCKIVQSSVISRIMSGALKMLEIYQLAEKFHTCVCMVDIMCAEGSEAWAQLATQLTVDALTASHQQFINTFNTRAELPQVKSYFATYCSLWLHFFFIRCKYFHLWNWCWNVYGPRKCHHLALVRLTFKFYPKNL